LKGRKDIMSREIKFRAWDGKRMLNRTLYDRNWYNDDDKCIKRAMPRDSNTLIVMQYTGLKDKNGKGKDVYEGDIFEIIYSDTPNGFKILGKEREIIEVYGGVIYKWSGFYVEHKEPIDGEVRYAGLAKFLENPKEIIGNVHQNPQLLGE
jgi:uncharacterized phage protein (TIGR01671 family)